MIDGWNAKNSWVVNVHTIKMSLHYEEEIENRRAFLLFVILFCSLSFLICLCVLSRVCSRFDGRMNGLWALVRCIGGVGRASA